MNLWHLVISITAVVMVLITRYHNSMRQTTSVIQEGLLFVQFINALFYQWHLENEMDRIYNRWALGHTWNWKRFTYFGERYLTRYYQSCGTNHQTRIFETNLFFQIWSLINLIWIWFASFADFICKLEKRKSVGRSFFVLKPTMWTNQHDQL